MEENDSFNVVVKVSEIEAWLAQNIKDKSSKIIAKTIIQNLKHTEVGLSQLYKAIQGIEERYKFAVGQTVCMHESRAYAWRMDKEKMREAKLIHKEMIEATVIHIQPWLSSCYKIRYKIIKEDNTEEPYDQNVSEDYLIEKDDYPYSS